LAVSKEFPMPFIRTLALGLVVLVAMIWCVAAQAQEIDDGTVDQLRRLKRLCDDGLVSPEICQEKQRILLGLGARHISSPSSGASPSSSLAVKPSPRAAEGSRSESQHPLGFSVSLPPGWTQVTSEELKAGREVLQKQLADEPIAKDFLKLLEALNLSDAGGYFRNDGDTLYIRRLPGVAPISPGSAEKTCQALSGRLSAMHRTGGGRAPVLHDCGLRQVASLPALYMEQDGARNGTRVIQLWVGKPPAETFQFILNCKPEHLAARRSELEAIVMGIQGP
jgi:hypothetical protein